MKVVVREAIEDAQSDDDGDDVTNDITMLNDGLWSVMFVLLLNFGTLADDPIRTAAEKKIKKNFIKKKISDEIRRKQIYAIYIAVNARDATDGRVWMFGW